MADQGTDLNSMETAYRGDPNAGQLYKEYLVKKHAVAIEDALNLPIDKQKELFRTYGVEPDKLMERYPQLIEKSEYLKQENINLSRSAKKISGWTLLSSLVTFALIPKRFFNDSPLLKGFLGTAGSMAAAMFAYLGATKAFTYRNRRDSLALSVEARDAMKRNLAVMFELVERGELMPQNPSAPDTAVLPQAQQNAGFVARVGATQSAAPSSSHVDRLKSAETPATPAL